MSKVLYSEVFGLDISNLTDEEFLELTERLESLGISCSYGSLNSGKALCMDVGFDTEFGVVTYSVYRNLGYSDMSADKYFESNVGLFLEEVEKCL